MDVPVDCACGHRFSVPESLVGGLAQCPECGKATEVPGLRDPLWRVLQVLALLAVVAAAWFGFQVGGAGGAMLGGAGTAVVLWVFSRGL
ncbi:MAG: hypothetical protein KDC87_15775 [Planctomycetes bacterium]|nr:hypothetical protein [Planctomycetota bacterium]MCB9869359.1 hypothetical protein [Planctomycetota bacterium]